MMNNLENQVMDYVLTSPYNTNPSILRQQLRELHGAGAPLILDHNEADYYGGHPEVGDEALEAIKAGRQILVRVPNADGGTNTAIYVPILMYQLPCNGYYLYLFYMKDDKQDLSAALGQPAGTVMLPLYGEFKMLLSKTYNEDPLKN